MTSTRRSLSLSFALALAAPWVVAACVDIAGLQENDPGSVDSGCVGAGCDDGGGTSTADGAVGDAADPLGCGSDQIRGDAGCVTVCAGKTCGMHMICGSGGSCECATAYGAADGGACAFTGGPLDPGFRNTPVAWTAAGGRVTIDASAAGSVEPGVAAYPNDCDPTASVTQSFPMPAANVAEPLAIDLSVAVPSKMAVNVGLGGRRFGVDFLGASFNYQRLQACLGERAYGGTIDLALGRTCGGVKLDHAGFVAAPLCPLPGQVANGDFESAVSAGSPGEWRVADGASVCTCGGGTCGSLTANDDCSKPTLLGGPVSVPTSGNRLALRFVLNAPSNVDVDVALYGAGDQSISLRRFVGRARGVNAPQLVTLCLPEWSRGLALPVELSLAPTDLSGGACATRGVSATVDKIEVTSEPSCEDPGLVFDPSFERGGGKLVYSYVPLDTTFASVTVPGYGGHTGTYFVRLEASGVPPRTRSLVVPITVPEGGHPAVKYFYRALVTGNVSATVKVEGAGAQDVAATDMWTEAHQCLPSARAGGPSSLTFSVSSSEYSGHSQIDVDDVSVGSDPACP